MSTELTKEEKELLARLESEGMGSNVEIDQSDITIPYIKLIQGSSDEVKNRQAAPGDYINSVTKETLGSIDDPVGIIVLDYHKDWIVQKKNGNRFERIANLPYDTLKGYSVPFFDLDVIKGQATYEYRKQKLSFSHPMFSKFEDGTYKLIETWYFSCILEKDASNRIKQPYRLILNGQAKRAAAKKILELAQLTKNESGKSFCDYVVKLSGSIDKGKDGDTFFRMDVSKGDKFGGIALLTAYNVNEEIIKPMKNQISYEDKKQITQAPSDDNHYVEGEEEEY